MKTKRSTKVLAMLFLTMTMVLLCSTFAFAKAKVDTKIRSYPQGSGSCSITFDAYGDTIKNLKSKSSSMMVKTTNVNQYRSSYNSDYNSKSATIQVYTKKAGTFKFSFDIYGKDGKKKTSHTVTVYSKTDSPLKSLKFGSRDLINYSIKNGRSTNLNYYTKAVSGKLSVKMNKGYKLKKIEIGKTKVTKKSDSSIKVSSETVYTKVKNGAKIKLSSTQYQYLHESGDPEPKEGDRYSSYNYDYSNEMFAYTYIRITYTDKYTKAEDTYTTSLRVVTK